MGHTGGQLGLLANSRSQNNAASVWQDALHLLSASRNTHGCVYCTHVHNTHTYTDITYIYYIHAHVHHIFTETHTPHKYITHICHTHTTYTYTRTAHTYAYVVHTHTTYTCTTHTCTHITHIPQKLYLIRTRKLFFGMCIYACLCLCVWRGTCVCGYTCTCVYIWMEEKLKLRRYSVDMVFLRHSLRPATHQVG